MISYNLKIYKLALLLLVSILVLIACSSAENDSKTTLKGEQWYTVSGYVDGDTFKVKVNDEVKTIRMLYIDTPETKKANTPVQPYGPEASEYTKQLLEESEEVKLSFDTETVDQFGRTLAIVELKDGRILNKLLLEQGLAKVLIVEPNVKMENVYKQLEQQAKQAGVGIWQEASNQSLADVPVKQASPTGITIEVNKRTELVTLINNSDKDYVLDGWKLVSVRGNQTYKFLDIILEANGTLEIHSTSSDSVKKDPDMLHWGEANIWNNYESDPAELYNSDNELVAIWEDSQQ